ncbi:MAG: hypothetical protein GXO80_08720 [Chlorobi bacterium]|nr:hypothetical protein [Chlorobiota bacterium]
MRKVFLLIFFYFINANFCNAQNSVLQQSVNVKFSDKSINEALNILTDKTNYYFSYDLRIVPEKKIISIRKTNVSLESILDSIFTKHAHYQIIGNHIVITKLTWAENKHITQDTLLIFSGKIINAKTKTAVPYVSVGILNTTKGTISNQNGEFSLKIPLKYRDSIVYISSIGFKSREYFVSALPPNKQIIQLKPEYISIQEVIIRNEDPAQIVKNAIYNTKKNYIRKKCLITSFYREGVIKNKILNNYSEALIKILKTPYKTIANSDKIKVVKSRKFINVLQKDTLPVKLKDGLYSSLQFDIVRNNFDFFNPEGMQNYNYRLIDIVPFNNHTLFVIEFNRKEYIKTSLYKGKLYIDNKTFALISAEFQINLKSENNSVNFVVKKNRNFIVKLKSAKYIVNYKEINRKYILNHVRADLIFKIRKKHSLFASYYKIFLENAAISYDFRNIKKFQRKEILKKNSVFIDNSYSYDAYFWSDDNFISPETSITDAIKKIRSKIKFTE